MRLVHFVIVLLIAAGAEAWTAPEKPGEAGSGTPAAGQAILLDINGAIGPAIASYISDGLDSAREQGARAVILRMDTPGGLDTSMRQIIKGILASPIPVLAYVAPSGARAASAGTYILYASHVAAMAPGTNLGAATPVQIGGGAPAPTPTPAPMPMSPPDGDKTKNQEPAKPAHPTMSDKALNDAVAYIRSLAQLRGRNADWAEQAVAAAASLSAKEALEIGVVDLMASSVADLLRKADGRRVRILDESREIATAGLEVTVLEPDWRTELLAVITNPSVAYLLLILGAYGLFLEFSNPGMVAPGVIGATSLVLALYAFQLLPVNYAGLALIVLGFALMVAEVFAPSFGALGIGGLASLILGSVLLMKTDVPGFGISPVLIGSVALVSGGLFLATAAFALKAWRRPVVTGAEALIGATGQVISWRRGRGRVRVHGELWSARGPAQLKAGVHIRVTGRDGLVLDVEPAADAGPKPKAPTAKE